MKKPKKIKVNNEDLLDLDNVPKHVAIIMDGNGRWAKKRLLPRSAGHIAGAERIRDIVEECIELDIVHLTIYAFSTENWKRPKKEVDMLMQLLIKYLKKETEDLHRNGVKIKILGDLEELPDAVVNEVMSATDKTKDNEKLNFNLAINYGSRQEILLAFKDMYSDLENGDFKLEDISEETISNYLYTKNQPDPDLVIRTSGEERISNFLLYQIAYSEFDFVEVLWPDFTREEFRKSIIKYQKRNRRYGGI